MSLSLREAEKIIDGTIAKATEQGVRVAVIVVDPAGLPVASRRMDGTLPWAMHVAEAKAVGSALWQRDGDYIAKVAEERPTQFQQLNALSVLRGVPLMPALGSLVIQRGEDLLGAVGVSGGSAAGDKVCAQAGIDSLLRLSQTDS